MVTFFQNQGIIKKKKEKRISPKTWWRHQICKGVTKVFFWGEKVIFPEVFPSVKCLNFPVENFLSGRPKTNFIGFEKLEAKKKKKIKKYDVFSGIKVTPLLKLAFLLSLTRKYMLWEGFYHNFSSTKGFSFKGALPPHPQQGALPPGPPRFLLPPNDLPWRCPCRFNALWRVHRPISSKNLYLSSGASMARIL